MTIRVGIVGAGGIAKVHAAALRSTPNVQITAVHDVAEMRAAALAHSCGANVSRTVDDLIDASDAVFVCTWTAAHRAVVESAANRRRAVFCEKPLDSTLSGAVAMAETVAAAGITHQVGLSLRWKSAFAVLRHMLSDQADGRVLTATLHSQNRNRARVVSGWRGDRAIAGGGMLFEVGFHDLDLLSWLLGPVESVNGFTVGGTRPGLEDGASVSLAFRGGAVGSLVAVWHDAPSRHQSRRLQIVRERAEYVLDTDGSFYRLAISGPGDHQVVWSLDELNRRAAELELPVNPHAAFVHAVAKGRPATPDFADALRVHELLEAVHSSTPTDLVTSSP
jgi:myo-inositol 2-dehydrogenase/D-chiro-inositol 1-dehydrogenase